MTAQPESLREFPVQIDLPILWGDQDAFGHVNNTIPIRWFESSRIAYLESSGLESLMQASGTGPILASITCHFRRQLHYPDRVTIGARVSRVGRSSMTMEHAVYSHKLDEIAADGSSAVVLFDYAANRPVRIPDDLRQKIEAVEGKSFPR